MKNNASLFTSVLKSLSFAWRKNKKLFLILVLLNAFQGSIVYLQFTSLASIINQIVRVREGIESQGLISSSLLLGVSYLVPALVGNVIGYYRAVFNIEQELNIDLYRIEKQGSLDIATLESNSYQTLLRSAQEWGAGSILNIQDFIFSSANNFAGVITSMIILWSLNGWFVLFATLAAAPIYFFYRKYGLEVFRARWFSVDDHRIINNRKSHFDELHKAVDVILLKLGDWLRFQIEDRIVKFNKKVLIAEKRKYISFGLLHLWYLLFLFAVAALMTKAALAGTVAVGGLLLVFNTYNRFYQTINAYIELISLTEESARYAARWFELFELKPKVTSTSDAIRLKLTESPSIEFQNVSFRYPSDDSESPFVLRNLSFLIKPGEKLAVIGLNGSGKTTLIKLLCRIYDPTEGKILINGVDLRNIHLQDWQSVLGVLLQDFPNYNVSVRESIGIGRMEYKFNEAEMKEAAKFSGANDFIDAFPNTYSQLIWKGIKDGTDLSKGQHQRLAVARMFYRKAIITILDEPTASIDATNEQKIFNNLEHRMQPNTVILITHRFSSIKNADKILLLEHGKIIEIGTHKELTQVNGKYAELYAAQAKQYYEV